MSTPTPGVPSGPPMVDLDHGDLRPNMMAAAFITWTVALIFVLLRFWTRTRIVHALGLTDWCIALSLTVAGGYCITIVEQCKYGMGKHIYDIDMLADYSPMMEAWWFSLLCYILSLALTKMSICLLYLTIFTLEWARRACYAVLGVVILTSLFTIVATFTYFIPLDATWDPTVVPSFSQPQAVWWANTAFVIATDLLIFILPIPIVLPLKLPRRQKVAVVGVFAVGFFVCLVSLIRLPYLIKARAAGTDPDFTYTGIPLLYWTVLEVHTAIVVACAMTLKPLLARLFPNLLASGHMSGSSAYEYSTTSPSGGSGGGGGAGGEVLTIGSRRVRGGREEMRADVFGVVEGKWGEGRVVRDVEAGMRVQGDGEEAEVVGLKKEVDSSRSGSEFDSESHTIKNGDAVYVIQNNVMGSGP